MMMHMPRDIDPTSTASAMFFSSTISRHSAYGVSLSRMAKDTTKIRMPRTANMIAFTSGISIISFASCVVRETAVNGAVSARIVAHAARNVFGFARRAQGPAAVLGHAGGEQHQQAVSEINRVPEHNQLA